MIDPPRVPSEEPTAVTPHGGICGGESQQWLSYPTKPHAGICAGAVSNPRPYRDQANELYIFTHPDMRPPLEMRVDRLLAAYRKLGAGPQEIKR